MKKQVVSKKLYIEGLRKIKIPSIIFLAIIVLSQLIVPLTEIITGTFRTGHLNVVGPPEIMAPLSFIAVVMAPILTLSQFFSFNKRSSSDFYQSLPYTRTCLFFSWVLSVLTVVAALFVIGGALGYAVRAFYPTLFVLTVTGMGNVIFTFFSAAIFGMGCVLIAMSLTGMFLPNVTCSLLIMFLPRMIAVIIRNLIMKLTPVLNTQYFLKLFSFEYNTFITGFGSFFGYLVGAGNDYSRTNLGPKFFTLAVGLVYIAIAAFLFKRRKSETATNPATGRLLQGIIRVALSFAVSLLATFLWMNDADIVFVITLYTIALIIFFAYEIITTRRWKNLLRAFPSLLIVIVLNAAVALFAYGYSRAVLNQEISADQIKSVRIINERRYYHYGAEEGYFDTIGNDIEIKNGEVEAAIAEALASELKLAREGRYEEADFNWSTKINLARRIDRTVAIKIGGKTFYRFIRFNEDQTEIITKGIVASDEYRQAYMTLPEPINDTISCYVGDYWEPQRYGVDTVREGKGFSSAKAKELFETLQKEISEAEFADWFEFINYDEGVSVEPLWVSYNANSTGHNLIEVPVSVELTPRSYDMVLELIYECQDIERFKEVLPELLKWTKAEAPFFEIGMSIWKTDDKGEYSIESLYGSMYQYKEKIEDAENPEKIAEIVEKSLQSEDIPNREAFIVLYYTFEKHNEDMGIGIRDTLVLPVPEDYVPPKETKEK